VKEMIPDFRTKSGVEIEKEMELDVNIYPNFHLQGKLLCENSNN